MMLHKGLLLLAASMMASSCKFGNDAIQSIHNNFESFLKTKAFDPTDRTVPLQLYYYHKRNDGIRRLAIKIDGDYMVEYYKKNDSNDIETRNGQYAVNMSETLNYKRAENGEFSFEGWSNGNKFEYTLRSINAELPNDFEEDYKKVLADFNLMRKKLFDFKDGLSKEELERVELFESHSRRTGVFYTYIENGVGTLMVSVDLEKGTETISGTFMCGGKDQKYNVEYGKVTVDGEPHFPVYY